MYMLQKERLNQVIIGKNYLRYIQFGSRKEKHHRTYVQVPLISRFAIMVVLKVDLLQAAVLISTSSA